MIKTEPALQTLAWLGPEHTLGAPRKHSPGSGIVPPMPHAA